MISKKRKAVWLLGVLLLLLAATAFSQSTIKLTDVYCAVGKKATVKLQGPGDGIAGINFTIGYDSAQLKNPLVTLGALATGFTLEQNIPTAGELRAVIYNDPVTTFGTGQGDIAIINFDIDITTEHCTNLVLDLADGSEPEKMGISDADGNSITSNYTLEDGSILATIPGDFNADKAVNLTDFTLLVVGWGSTYTLSDFTMLVAHWMMSCP
jgi:hypothetical protein